MENSSQAISLTVDEACTTKVKARSDMLVTGSKVATLGFQSYMAYRSYKNHKNTLRAVGAWFGYGLLAAIPLTGINWAYHFQSMRHCTVPEDAPIKANENPPR